MQTARFIDSDTNRNPFMRYLVLSVLAAFLFAPAAFAQGGGMQQGAPPPAEVPEVEVDDQELDAIAHAYIDVQEVLVEYRPQLGQAEDAEQAQQIQQKMAAEATSAIEDRGVEPQRFDRVIRAVEADLELRERLTDRLEELTAGEEQ